MDSVWSPKILKKSPPKGEAKGGDLSEKQNSSANGDCAGLCVSICLLGIGGAH
jgi:hypothetical protein